MQYSCNYRNWKKTGILIFKSFLEALFVLTAENSLPLKSQSALSVCFQSSWLSCLRRRASSLLPTTTSSERRSTRRRGFVFPECSCRANSPSPANHRAPDVCHRRNAQRFVKLYEAEVWITFGERDQFELHFTAFKQASGINETSLQLLCEPSDFSPANKPVF